MPKNAQKVITFLLLTNSSRRWNSSIGAPSPSKSRAVGLGWFGLGRPVRPPKADGHVFARRPSLGEPNFEASQKGEDFD